VLGGEASYLLESLVNDVWMLKMVIGEEVELVEEIPDVYAGEWIHLRERKNAWESAAISIRARIKGRILT
jgi:hypothetical protein